MHSFFNKKYVRINTVEEFHVLYVVPFLSEENLKDKIDRSRIWANRTSVLAPAVALTVWLHLVVLSLSVLIRKIGPVFVIKSDNSVK